MESKHITALAIVLAVALSLFLSSSVFGCIVDDGTGCLLRPASRPTISFGGSKTNAMMLADPEQNQLHADLVQFITGKLREGEPKPTGEFANMIVLLPLHSDAELDQMMTTLIVRDAGDNLVSAHLIALVSQEQTRRFNERLLAQQIALRRAAQQAALLQPAPALALPGSPDPYAAPEPQGNWAYIQPHTTIWYKANDHGRRLNVWMDANHESDLVLAIYGPDQTDVWNSKPIGQAMPGNGFDFWWTGRSLMKGDWRIRVTNLSDNALPYRLFAKSHSETAGDMCRDCHGNIGDDQYTRCEHKGNWCDDLKNEYKH